MSLSHTGSVSVMSCNEWHIMSIGLLAICDNLVLHQYGFVGAIATDFLQMLEGLLYC